MRTAALLLAISLVPLTAFAQTAKPAAPPGGSTHVFGAPAAPAMPATPSAAVTAPLGPAAGPPAGSPSAAVVTVPPPPDVSDPLLAPVPAPRRILKSWRDAVDLLRSRSTDLRQAVDQVLQAEAQTRIALAQYLPLINGQGSYSHQIITNPSANGGISLGTNGLVTSNRVPNPNSFNGSIQVTQDIINLPEFDQISVDELSEDAARLSVDDEKRTLALSVANQIVAVVTAERDAEINRVGLRVALEQAEITNRKAALGAANGLDVVRAKQNVANARASLVTGDETLRETRESLGLALGVPEETGVSPDVDVSGLALEAASSCKVVTSVDERSDVAAARVRLDVAKRTLRNIWYTFLPTVTASSSLQAASPASIGLPNPLWSISGVLQVPIWDGGTRYGNLRNARAAEDIAAAQLESARRQAIVQVEQAQRQLVVNEESARVAKEQRDLAAQNDQMTQLAYATGQGTSLELVTASEAHRQAELSYALAEFNVVKARLLAQLALATCPW
ncbi:MAG TPA: TolC family protein [Polyangiaceae bacterium]|jgi:outer membrane protein TolC|nr:TolC family protein [Polyangiaceae bacterium]